MNHKKILSIITMMFNLTCGQMVCNKNIVSASDVGISDNNTTGGLLNSEEQQKYEKTEKYLIERLMDEGILSEIVSDLTAKVVNRIKAKNIIYDLKKINSKSCMKAISGCVKDCIDAEMEEESNSPETRTTLWLEGRKSIQELINKWKKDKEYEKKIYKIAKPYASELQKNITEQVRENNNIIKGKRKDEIEKKIKKLSKKVVDKQK